MKFFVHEIYTHLFLSGGSDAKKKKKKILLQGRRTGFNLGSRRSPGEGNGNPLQYSYLENSMDRGAWWATVHRVAKSKTQLSN